VGTGRALEIVLGADDLDAVTAEKWGWLNRALAPGELDAFVDRLARRIAGFPAGAVASAKASVLLAGDDLTAGLTEESRRFSELVVTPEAKARMAAFLARGGQTAEGELRVGELSTELASEPGPEPSRDPGTDEFR
jgi:enoyl-CoA hydratase/carnithine racemase